MALTEIQLKIQYVGFMAPLAKKVPDPCYRQKRESLGFSDNNTTIIKSPVF